MKSLVLLAAVAAAAYYYYLQHPTVADRFLRRATHAPATADAAPMPRQHYHSPLDAANNHSSAGFYSSEPAERYELTGANATKATRPIASPAAGED